MLIRSWLTHNAPARLRSRAARLGSVLGTVFVIAMFASLWAWGHNNHWSFPKSAASGAKTPKAASPEFALAGKDSAFFPPVRFENESNVREAGLSLASAKRATLEETIATTAEVAYNQYRVGQVASRVPGHVYAIRTRLGQSVKKGDILALVDSEHVGRAKSEYLQEVFLTRYKSDLLQRLRSAGSGVVPDRTVLDAEAAIKEAELRRFTAQQKLINLGLTPPDPERDAPATPQEFARHIQFLGLPDGVVSAFQPRPQTANLIPLISPLDGVVIRQEAIAGDVVNPDKPQFVVADVSVMWINMAVRKEDAGQLRLGQSVRFTATGLPGPVFGTLDWVGHEADEESRTLRARCEVPNPRPRDRGAEEGGRWLRANLFGTAVITTGRREGAVVVPDAAVQRMPDGMHLVFVKRADGTTFDPRRVRLGLSREGATEVVEGIAPGEPVVTDGSYVLKSEMVKEP